MRLDVSPILNRLNQTLILLQVDLEEALRGCAKSQASAFSVSTERNREVQKGVAEAPNLLTIYKGHPFENRVPGLELPEEMVCFRAKTMGMQAERPLFLFRGNVDLDLIHEADERE